MTCELQNINLWNERYLNFNGGHEFEHDVHVVEHIMELLNVLPLQWTMQMMDEVAHGIMQTDPSSWLTESLDQLEQIKENSKWTLLRFIKMFQMRYFACSRKL